MKQRSQAQLRIKALLLFSLLFSCTSFACSDSASKPTPSPPKTPSKQALYGDPKLVPTPQGERIRQELVFTSELQTALQTAYAFEQLHISISLDQPKDPKVTIVGQFRDKPTNTNDLTVQAVQLASQIIPSVKMDSIHTAWNHLPPKPTKPSWAVWLTALSLLGCGLCIGVAVERYRSEI